MTHQQNNPAPAEIRGKQSPEFTEFTMYVVLCFDTYVHFGTLPDYAEKHLTGEGNGKNVTELSVRVELVVRLLRRKSPNTLLSYLPGDRALKAPSLMLPW